MTQTTEIGGYEILAELASGGMGDVFVARRLGAHGFAKLVALKTIRRDKVDKQGVREMFLNEAKLVARLDHPAIAQVHDFGDEDGTLYLAMEYVAGLSFDQIADQADPPMPPDVAVRAMIEVCRGLHAAHEAVGLDGEPLGVVHRDVSPQNLMLTFEGHIKILDFGIARAVDRVGPETQTGTLKGKPAYMSPEQMATSRVDRRADIFSASVVLYEVLTGEPLFAADNIFALADKVRGAVIPPPSQKVDLMPEGLDAVVLRGLARDPDGRYPTAAAMADELETIANAVGSESLESYAERAMVHPRTEHRAFIHDLITNEGTAPRPALTDNGRPPDVATLAAEGNTADTILRDTGEALAAAGLRRNKPVVWGAAVILLVGLGTGGLWLTGNWPGATPAVTPPTETAAVEPPVVEPPVEPPVIEPKVEANEPQPTEPAKKKTRKKKKRSGRGKTKSKTTDTEPNPPPPPTEFGFLKVTAKPYANVRIDGRLVGPTPLMRHRLSVGEHELELIDPETGATRLTRTITVEEDRLAKLDAP